MDATDADIHMQLANRLERARLGGSEQSRKKQVAAGKLLVRDRLDLLLGPSPSFEDGLLARADEGLPGDTVVTCFGTVETAGMSA